MLRCCIVFAVLLRFCNIGVDSGRSGFRVFAWVWVSPSRPPFGCGCASCVRTRDVRTHAHHAHHAHAHAQRNIYSSAGAADHQCAAWEAEGRSSTLGVGCLQPPASATLPFQPGAVVGSGAGGGHICIWVRGRLGWRVGGCGGWVAW